MKSSTSGPKPTSFPGFLSALLASLEARSADRNPGNEVGLAFIIRIFRIFYESRTRELLFYCTIKIQKPLKSFVRNTCEDTLEIT